MTDTTPQARRVMGNGGEIARSMAAFDKKGRAVLVLGRPLDPRHGDSMMIRHDDPKGSVQTYSERARDLLPDLNDPATCAVLWGQFKQACESRDYSTLRTYEGALTHVYVFDGDGRLMFEFTHRPQADALAAAFEWVAALEVKHGQD